MNLETKEIKIGQSQQPLMRLNQLREEEKAPLLLLGVVEDVVPLEKKLHRKFEGCRTRGEWFKASTSLLDYVSKLNGDISSPTMPVLETYPPSIVRGWNSMKATLKHGELFKRSDIEQHMDCSRQWACSVLLYGRSQNEIEEQERGIYVYISSEESFESEINEEILNRLEEDEEDD
jgi:hypothetical protein